MKIKMLGRGEMITSQCCGWADRVMKHNDDSAADLY